MKLIYENNIHKLTFPMANNPLSNKRQTPRNRNATPNPANPTPISENIKRK